MGIILLATMFGAIASSMTINVKATIYPGLTTGMWFKYDVSLIVSPSFGIFQFSFDETYKLTITSISSSLVNFTKTEESGNIPLNATQIFDVTKIPIVIPTEVLMNDSFTINNVSIAFPSSVETDAGVFWRGIPIKLLDLSSVFSSDILSVVTTRQAYMKFDNKTGMMYKTYISASLNLPLFGSNTQFDVFLSLNMIDASNDYKSVMVQSFDSTMNPSFIWYDVYTSPWFIVGVVATVILSLIFILLIRRQRKPSKKKKEIAVKAPKKRKEQMKETASKRTGRSVKI